MYKRQNGLASKVSSTDYNGQTVASMISQSSTAVSIIANSLNLSGYVTFSSLGPYGNTVIDGSRIQTGYISADRIEASMIRSKLLQAGGISADYITSGTFSGSRIYGGTIEGVMINTTQNLNVGDRIYLNGGYNAGLYFDRYGATGRIYSNGNNMVISSDAMDLWTFYGLKVQGGIYNDGQWIPPSRTEGLGFGFSSASGLLYVSLNGSDRGSVKIS